MNSREGDVSSFHAFRAAESSAPLPRVCLELAEPPAVGASEQQENSREASFCKSHFERGVWNDDSSEVFVSLESWTLVEDLFIRRGVELSRSHGGSGNSVEVSSQTNAASSSAAKAALDRVLFDGFPLEVLKADSFLLPEGILAKENLPAPLPHFSPRFVLNAQRRYLRQQLRKRLGKASRFLLHEDDAAVALKQVPPEAEERRAGIRDVSSLSLAERELADAPSLLAQVLTWSSAEVSQTSSLFFPLRQLSSFRDAVCRRVSECLYTASVVCQTLAELDPIDASHRVPPSLLPQWLDFEPRRQLPLRKVKCEIFEEQLKSLHADFQSLPVPPPPKQLRLAGLVASEHANKIRRLSELLSSEGARNTQAADGLGEEGGENDEETAKAQWKAVCSYIRFYLLSGFRAPQASEVIAWGSALALVSREPVSDLFSCCLSDSEEQTVDGSQEIKSAPSQNAQLSRSRLSWILSSEAFPLSEQQLELTFTQLSPLRTARAVCALRNSRFERSLALQNIDSQVPVRKARLAEEAGYGAEESFDCVSRGSLIISVSIFDGERPQTSVAGLEFLEDQTLFDLRRALRGCCSAETTSAGVGGVNVTGSCFLINGFLFYDASCPTSTTQYALPLRKHFKGEGRLAVDSDSGEEGPLRSQQSSTFRTLEVPVGDATSALFLHAGTCAHRVVFTGVREWDSLRDPQLRSAFPLRTLSAAVKSRTCHVCREASAARAVANSILCSVYNPTLLCADCWRIIASPVLGGSHHGEARASWTEEADPFAQSFALFDGTAEQTNELSLRGEVRSA